MKKTKRIVITVFFILCSFIYNVQADTAETGMRTISSIELVADMGAGWNLGNTLDAETKDETGWGNPKTTKAMIDELHNKGFKTIRLPVTWRFHLGGAPDYIIEEAWLNRVEEVANYAFDNDMYVIINIHHDDTWIIPTYEKASDVKVKLIKVWTQIANRFKNYGDYLIFETLNEPRYEGSPEEWSGGTAEGRDVVNQYQKTCVDAIRATGGNNAERHLMVSTYAAAGYGDALKDFKIPNDDERVIVSIHNYSPFDFTLQEGGRSDWGSSADKAALDADMDKLYNKFILNGRAVVLGEWCATNRSNLTDREIYYKYFMHAALERKLRPIYWDIGASNGSGLLDRNKLSWFFPTLVDAIIETVREFDCPEIVTTVKDLTKDESDRLMCYQNEEGTIIKYGLNKTSKVNISVLTVAGVIIKKILSNQTQSSGNYNYKWSGNAYNGSRLANGIYLIVFDSEGRREVKRVILAR